MSIAITRRAAVAAFTSLVWGRWAFADKPEIVMVTCPICNENYKTLETVSSSQSGVRLDLRPLGSGSVSPPRIPVCPKCGFVDFRYGAKYPADELKTLKEYVNSDDYKKLVKSDTSYFRLAKTFELLKQPPGHTAFAYLKATWQVENNKDTSKAYLSACLDSYENAIKDPALKGNELHTAKTLKGELLRRLGKFADAKKYLESLQKDADLKEEPFPVIIEAELQLIEKKDDQPRERPNKKDK